MPFGIGDAVDNPDSATLASQAGQARSATLKIRSVAANLAFVIIVDKKLTTMSVMPQPTYPV